MHTPSTSRRERRVRSLVACVIRVPVLLLPACLLLIGVLRTDGQPQTMLALGAFFQLLVCFLSFVSPRGWRDAMAPSVIVLYLIALGWLWLARPPDDWYAHLTQAVLLVVP